MNRAASTVAAEPPWRVDLCLHAECHCAPAAPRPGTRRLALRVLGCAAAGLAVVGAALPLLPTTPFALVSAWALARSSPRLNAWLRNHPRLGPPLAAWERERAIPRPAKLAASASLPASWLSLWAAGSSPAVLAVAGGVLLTAGLWILTRPSGR